VDRRLKDQRLVKGDLVGTRVSIQLFTGPSSIPVQLSKEKKHAKPNY